MAARILEQCLEFDPWKAFIKLLKVKCMVYFKYSKIYQIPRNTF